MKTIATETEHVSCSVEQLLSTAAQQLENQSESTQLDAEVLLAHVLKQSRTWLRTWPQHHLTDDTVNTYKQLVKQRHQGIPIAYLTGQRDFWLHTFKVSADVLIPRPETELLVEQCLQIIPPDKPHSILELGTGSGAIAISIAAERKRATVTATDISEAALAIARSNAATTGLVNIEFIHSNWFANLTSQRYDLIVSNPPYIPLDDEHLHRGDVRFEPRLALTSGSDGLRDIRIIVDLARQFLGNNAYLALEHGYDQADAVECIMNNHQYRNIHNYRDLQGNQRVTIAQYHC